jgi:hypothetical protein
VKKLSADTALLKSVQKKTSILINPEEEMRKIGELKLEYAVFVVLLGHVM